MVHFTYRFCDSEAENNKKNHDFFAFHSLRSTHRTTCYICKAIQVFDVVHQVKRISHSAFTALAIKTIVLNTDQRFLRIISIWKRMFFFIENRQLPARQIPIEASRHNNFFIIEDGLEFSMQKLKI